ncbi:MAG: hypothetical protein WBD48_04000 [Pseudolabrys sp.]
MAEGHKRLQSLLWLAFVVTAIVSQAPWWFPSLLTTILDPVLASFLLLPVQILLAGIIIYRAKTKLWSAIICGLGLIVGLWWTILTMIVFAIWSINGFAP